MLQRLRFFGTDTPTGVGTHCSQTIAALKSFQIEKIDIELIKHNYLNEVKMAIENSKETDINIFFFSETYSEYLKGIKIYWCVFESSRLPPGYDNWLDKHHFIFSTSHWGRNIMIECGMDGNKIFVIPEGVDHKFFNPYGRPTAVRNSKTKFLMVGKYERKKGYIEAFEALKIAAITNPNIELLTKSDWINGSDANLHPEFIQLVQRHMKDFTIQVYTGNFTREQMQSLYYSSDYFLHPSRCEGWSLPLIEAIACGLPCLTTRYGGHSEYLGFLNDEDIIQTVLKPVDCDFFTGDNNNYDWGQWAFPDVQDLAQRILKATEKPARSGIAGSDYVRKNYSWDVTAEKIINFVYRIRI